MLYEVITLFSEPGYHFTNKRGDCVRFLRLLKCGEVRSSYLAVIVHDFSHGLPPPDGLDTVVGYIFFKVFLGDVITSYSIHYTKLYDASMK